MKSFIPLLFLFSSLSFAEAIKVIPNDQLSVLISEHDCGLEVKGTPVRLSQDKKYKEFYRPDGEISYAVNLHDAPATNLIVSPGKKIRIDKILSPTILELKDKRLATMIIPSGNLTKIKVSQFENAVSGAFKVSCVKRPKKKNILERTADGVTKRVNDEVSKRTKPDTKKK